MAEARPLARLAEREAQGLLQCGVEEGEALALGTLGPMLLLHAAVLLLYCVVAFRLAVRWMHRRLVA